MIIDPNKDNGSITIKKVPYKKGYYMYDTLTDRKILLFLGLPLQFPENEIDNINKVASDYGFDIKEYLDG